MMDGGSILFEDFGVDMLRTTWPQAGLTLLWANIGIPLVIHMVRWIIIKMPTGRELSTGLMLLTELQVHLMSPRKEFFIL